MKTCLKVVVMVLLAVLLAAGAALACDNPSCLFPGLDPEQAAWLPLPPGALVLACEGGDCGLYPGSKGSDRQGKNKPGMMLACPDSNCLTPGSEGFTPPAAGGKQKSNPGIQLACNGDPCPNRPGIEGSTPPAAGGKQKTKPGIQLACSSLDCLSPGLQDERLAAEALRRKLLVCIAETCGLTPGLADIMLSCGNANCFAPVPEAEGRAVR